MKGGNFLSNRYYKVISFNKKKQYTEWKSKKDIKEYLNKYIDEEVDEILFIVPDEKQKKSPTTIPQ